MVFLVRSLVPTRSNVAGHKLVPVAGQRKPVFADGRVTFRSLKEMIEVVDDADGFRHYSLWASLGLFRRQWALSQDRARFWFPLTHIKNAQSI